MSHTQIADSHTLERNAIRTLIPLTLGLGVGAVLATLLTLAPGKKSHDELDKTVDGSFVEDWSGGDLAGVDTALVAPERSVKSFLSKIWTR